MTATVETFEFKSEGRQVLDLMIHSVYSNREIFLRELISNASDALDKLRFEALTDPKLAPLADDLRILIEPDAAARTLTISDSGIGMSRDEVIRYIGTIAKSGTKEFLAALDQARKDSLPPELIGQFGVGFYSAFMVSDRVTLRTRRAGEEAATQWESSGDGTYTLQEIEKADVGTTIVLHLKEVGTEEDEAHDFTADWTLRSLIRKYSDYVVHPIRLKSTRMEVEEDEDGNPKPGAEPREVVEEQTVNSMKAIWRRGKGEATDEEHHEFYKHISHDWNEPLAWTQLKAEGTLEFSALLYLPSKAPMDMWMRDAGHGVQLYVKRIFIMGDCKELLPDYLRFARGVVDSEDLSLNISREILQQNRQIRLMRKRLTHKLLEMIRDLRKKEPEKFATFWGEFGRVVKEGLGQDQENRDALLEFVQFRTTKSGDAWVTLGEYMDRMKTGQEAIYFLAGESRAAVENSPHLEAFRERDIEVLILTDPIDEIWPEAVHRYKELNLASVGKGAVELGGDAEKKQKREEIEAQAKEHKDLLEALRGKLDDRIKEVRLSSRLTQSPACLVSDEHDISPHLEQLLRATGQDVPKIKRILELNPNHPILARLEEARGRGQADAELTDTAELLYGQAVLAEGGQLPDPARFSKLVADLMVRAV